MSGVPLSKTLRPAIRSRKCGSKVHYRCALESWSSWAPEELKLGGGRGAAQHRVAMRKAAEAADDFEVMLGVLDVTGHRGNLRGEPVKEPRRFLLVGEILAVLKRHIDERPLDRGQRQVESARDRVFGRRARLGVGREGARMAAEHVARKLIEQKNQSQRA